MMQDLFGSVRRSLFLRPVTAGDDDPPAGGAGGRIADKIGSCLRKSRVGLGIGLGFQHRLPSPPAPLRPPAAETEVPPIRWRKGELIGNGAFGYVYMGMNLDSGELLAVKQVQIGTSDASRQKAQAHVRELEEEVKLLKNLSHPNIVRYLGTAREEDTLNILLEFVPGGSISSLLGKFGSFPEAVIRMYTKQLMQGLEYLHRNKIMHRDIKGANILVDNKGCIKLADFGASKQVAQLATITAAKSMKGTPYWMAPEVIVQSGHSLLPFKGVESSYRPFTEIVESRMKRKLDCPLHVAAYYLNPFYFYGDAGIIQTNVKVNDGFFSCMETFYPDLDIQDEITSVEMKAFKDVSGLSGRPVAVRQISSIDENFNPVLPKYFSSEWSFAQFHLPEVTRYIVAFGPQNTVLIISLDGSSADIWSVGCTVIEMATGKPPWSQQYQEVAALFHVGTTKSHPPIPEHLSLAAKDFLLKCLQQEPNLRPTASDLLQHPFVTGVYQDTHSHSSDMNLSTIVPPTSTSHQNLPSTTSGGLNVNYDTGKCSSMLSENLFRSSPIWEMNADDEICRLDDEDDFPVVGSSFNQVPGTIDVWPCKIDLSSAQKAEPQDFDNSVNDLSSSRKGETDFTFPCEPMAEDDEEAVTETKIIAFLDEKALELKKLYEGFYNTFNTSSSPTVGNGCKENVSNNSKLPPKSRLSPSKLACGTPAPYVDTAGHSSPGNTSRRISNSGMENSRILRETVSPQLNELGELLQDPRESSSLSAERQRKWEEELYQELERSREMRRQAGIGGKSPSDGAQTRKRDRFRFNSAFK